MKRACTKRVRRPEPILENNKRWCLTSHPLSMPKLLHLTGFAILQVSLRSRSFSTASIRIRHNSKRSLRSDRSPRNLTKSRAPSPAEWYRNRAWRSARSPDTLFLNTFSSFPKSADARLGQSSQSSVPSLASAFVTDEMTLSAVSGKKAAAAHFTPSPISGRLGLPEDFARCEVTGAEVLRDDLVRIKCRGDNFARTKRRYQPSPVSSGIGRNLSVVTRPINRYSHRKLANLI